MTLTDYKKDFITILSGLDSAFNDVENFRNFIEMAFCALAKTTHTAPAIPVEIGAFGHDDRKHEMGLGLRNLSFDASAQPGP